jgi:hypothetical protein
MNANRILFYASIAAIAACKIDVDVPAGGSVTTNSGSLSCSANSSCTLDVAGTYFDETFVANPAPGFDFIGWKSGPARLCAGSTEPCRFSTTGLAGNEDAIALLDDPNLVVYLEPAFVSEGAEPEALLGATFACPWDESDPTLHVFLAAGQSNMVSVYGQSGTLPEKYVTGTDRLQMWDQGSWKRLGLSTENGNRVPRYGPELGFAWTLHAACPESNIGIIKYAVGGTSITTWIPGGENSAALVANVVGALQAGTDITFEGFLYKQAGGDSRNRTLADAWGENFLSIVDTTRSAGVIPNDLPFLLATSRGTSDNGFPDDLTGFDPDSVPSPDPSRAYILYVIYQQWMVQFERPGIYPVIERDIPIGADGIHQTPEGIRMVGRGLAEVYLRDVN